MYDELCTFPYFPLWEYIFQQPTTFYLAYIERFCALSTETYMPVQIHAALDVDLTAPGGQVKNQFLT